MKYSITPFKNGESGPCAHLTLHSETPEEQAGMKALLDSIGIGLQGGSLMACATDGSMVTLIVPVSSVTPLETLASR